MKTPGERKGETPWWLLGDQQCNWCLQEYALETEIRCAHCDDAVCRDCVVEIRVENLLLCGPCADAYAAEFHSDGSGH